MQTKTSNWLSAYEAIPLSLKLPLEITRFKLDQFGAGQAAANAGFIDLFATVCSSRAEGAQLGGGEGGHGSGTLLCGVIDDRPAGRMGPRFILDPKPLLLRVEVFAGDYAAAFTLDGYAVLRGELPLSSRPRCDVSKVFVPQNPSDGGLCCKVLNYRVSGFFVGSQYFNHCSSLISLD